MSSWPLHYLYLSALGEWKVMMGIGIVKKKKKLIIIIIIIIKKTIRNWLPEPSPQGAQGGGWTPAPSTTKIILKKGKENTADAKAII